jgi:hypothetical protein
MFAPIFAGFALNTIFYGLGFWLILRMRALLRTLFRARRNQCLACGYPIGASPICTECGSEVPSAARIATNAKAIADT